MTPETPAQSEHQPASGIPKGKPPGFRRKANRRSPHTALDARTWQARLLRKTEADLAAHVGGAPSVTQWALVKRAAWLTVYLAELDARAKAGTFMTPHAAAQYLAWSNSLTRTIAQIGLEPPPSSAAPETSLAAYLASKAAAP